VSSGTLNFTHSLTWLYWPPFRGNIQIFGNHGRESGRFFSDDGKWNRRLELPGTPVVAAFRCCSSSAVREWTADGRVT